MHFRRALAGLAAASLLAACAPGPLRATAPTRPDGPAHDAARYGVLTANSVCPSGLIVGAGTYSGGQAFSFALVDGGATDRGRLQVTIGGVAWVDPSPAVTVDRSTPIPLVRITGLVAHPTTGATTPVAFEFGGFGGPVLLLDDVPQIIEAFSDVVPGVDGSCVRYNGGGTGTVTVTNPFGGTRTVTLALAFDVTEDGTSDFGEVILTVDGDSTFTGTSPDVAFVGDDLVVSDTLIMPGQLVGVTELTFRIDLTNPTVIRAVNNGTTTVDIPLTSLFGLSGLCDVSIP